MRTMSIGNLKSSFLFRFPCTFHSVFLVPYVFQLCLLGLSDRPKVCIRLEVVKFVNIFEMIRKEVAPNSWR